MFDVLLSDMERRLRDEVGGRGLSWTAEMTALEEVGVLGSTLGCAFAMPSIVGAEEVYE